MVKKQTIRKLLQVTSDINAIRNGTFGKRVAKRIAGQIAGKAIRRIFK